MEEREGKLSKGDAARPGKALAAQLKKLHLVVSVGSAIVILHNKDLPGSLG